MSVARVTSMTPAGANDMQRLEHVKQAALMQLDAQDWSADCITLRLPRRRLRVPRQKVIAKQLLSDSWLTVWLTRKGEVWWSYRYGGRTILEQLPSDADASRVEEITDALCAIAFAA
ncbi:MAG TPA: hypothetical protein PK096_03510 [Candidatus Saccharibacteria bacterium]|nr:hypothetical protein [Candidatus Saccharibacteria bacterium]HRK94411.1 hypothetical protein [Candidatus Saccharibacteria bacterium]